MFKKAIFGLVFLAVLGTSTYLLATLISPPEAAPCACCGDACISVSYTHLTLPTIYSV